jgi:putative endopeptidase
VLQAPVLDLSRPLAVQYGAFGAWSATRSPAIDDKGRLIDAKGNLGDWWTRPTRRLDRWRQAGRQYDGRTWPQLRVPRSTAS